MLLDLFHQHVDRSVKFYPICSAFPYKRNPMKTNGLNQSIFYFYKISILNNVFYSIVISSSSFHKGRAKEYTSKP